MAAPLHGKAAEFRRLGLFSGIKRFAELERRIEALADEKQKGDALEMFAEAYLATQRVGMAKHVWPDKLIPPSIRKRLRLSARDVGADGVIETASGKHPKNSGEPVGVSPRTVRGLTPIGSPIFKTRCGTAPCWSTATK